MTNHRSGTLFFAMLLTFSLLFAGSSGGVASAIAPAQSQTATVTVQLTDLGLEFGAIGAWEASLYQGAIAGQETSGRFSAWKPVTDSSVVFELPEEISSGNTAPWNEADNTYVRVRHVGATAYPTFDLVSDPFTLVAGTYRVALGLSAGTPTTEVRVRLIDLGAAFGKIDGWEASLYKGAVAGQETSGRFTAWKAPTDGVVSFSLPNEISAGNTAPWGEADNTYVRVRATGTNAIPAFDLVGRPFTLLEGRNLDSQIELGRAVTSAPLAGITVAQTAATVTVNLADLGLAFGAVGAWEASLYQDAVAGQESSGRFTAWKPATGNTVSFTLPGEISAGSTAPWGEANNAYVRIRTTGANAFPTFDLVSNPFTLNDGTHTANFKLNATNFRYTLVNISLLTLGSAFGQIANWEASLYQGAVVGQETSGRFTAWKAPSAGVVSFMIPQEVTTGNTVPWDTTDAVYVRFRSPSGDAIFPTFDFVGAPFTITQGSTLNVQMHVTRTVDFTPSFTVYLPIIAQ